MGDIFRCRKFSLSNKCAGLKVGTDGILIGAASPLPCPATETCTVLDIGTGTGIIALILAQRLSESSTPFHIDAIDINPDAVMEATGNFASSPWGSSMEATLQRLQDFIPTHTYDLIVSNPPYYEFSPLSRDDSRDSARRASALSWRDIIPFAANHLSLQGRLSLILPADQETSLRRFAASFGLHPTKILRIRTTSRKAPSRIVAEFSLAANLPAPTSEQELTLMADGRYTLDYVNLVKDIYLDSYFKDKV